MRVFRGAMALPLDDTVNRNTLRYFNYQEFDSPDFPGSGVVYMRDDFLKMLDDVRHHSGFPFLVNSGYRTRKYNESLKGSSSDSAHIYGKASDIHMPSLEHMRKAVNVARSVGFKRIGQYRTASGNWFIHLDNDWTKAFQEEWAFDLWGSENKRVDLWV